MKQLLIMDKDQQRGLMYASHNACCAAVLPFNDRYVDAGDILLSIASTFTMMPWIGELTNLSIIDQHAQHPVTAA